jgi:hypothetical protein
LFWETNERERDMGVGKITAQKMKSKIWLLPQTLRKKREGAVKSKIRAITKYKESLFWLHI